MPNEKNSLDSLADASLYRAQGSGHGAARGAAGYKEKTFYPDTEFLSTSGQFTVINPRDDGFGRIRISAAWDNVARRERKGLRRLFKKPGKGGVDIDIGCLYELTDGTRGCVQAFGSIMGAYDAAPYIDLSGDERTGDTPGDDEYLRVNGHAWNEIKRVLFYAYIYSGVPNWAAVKPYIQISIPGEHPMVVVPDVEMSALCVCAIASMENVRGGIRLTNESEYFPGHAEMDRAFGYGIDWMDGKK